MIAHEEERGKEFRMGRTYTRTGDDGTTGRFRGERLRKSSVLIDLLGILDEANAVVGLARSFLRGTDTHRRTGGGERPFSRCDFDEALREIQDMIFRIGADVSTPLSSSLDRARRIAAEDTKNLEGKIDALEESLSELREFIVPGGTSSAATLHLARAIVRRAERAFFRAVEEGEELNEALGTFLNRLSSYLFALARLANAIGGYREEHPRYSVS